MPRDNYEAYLKSLEKKRAPAMKQAMQLILQERYDEAEQTVTRVDDSAYARHALSKLFRQHLADLVEQGKHQTHPATAAAVFHRARSLAYGCYPDPHTRIEAENFERGRAEDLAQLVKILGYEPPRPAE